MHFAEAERTYRELESKLLSGELQGEEFLAQASKLKVKDEEGRRWMISARTGRWLLHDGRQWVFAEPPTEALEAGYREMETEPWLPPLESPAPEVEYAAPEPVTQPAGPPEPRARRTARRTGMPRFVTIGLAAALIAACLIAIGVPTWVLILRDRGEPAPAGAEPSAISMVVTYTPRPATATYTPTPTATPTRTPLPPPTAVATLTPTATPTAIAPTPTPDLAATATRSSTAVAQAPSATAEPTATATPTAQTTYTVRLGDTLSEIAVRFGVTTRALAQENGISNQALIRPGQVLVIPAPESVAQGPSPTPTWTPIVVGTRTSGTATTAEATSTATRTPTPSTPTATATPRPTAKPKPTATPTPKPAPLSGKIAFAVWNPDLIKYELFVSDINGSGRVQIGQGFRQPQFRPDGAMLATNGDGAPNLEHMVTMNPGGDGKVEISNYAEDSYPTWSPDGSIVAYSSLAYGDGQSRLGIVYDMFGKNWEWVRMGTTEIRGQYPYWMENGQLVYSGCDFLYDHAACGLYKVNSNGGSYQRLTNHTSDTAPAGSGTRVAFMSARDGNWEVYLINQDGTGLKRLSNNGAQDGLPTWSPDGKTIAFVSNRGGGWAIWAMDANGNNQRKLFDLGGGYGSGQYDWTTERISWAP